MRVFVRGDIDGFFGLALDNMVQLILIGALCKGVLGFPDELLYGRVLPGVALSLLIGNLFYAWQAYRLGVREGRDDVCAQPYGINTVSLFAYVFLVMLPVKLNAEQSGAENPAELAWRAGIIACLGSGLIEFFGAFVAEKIRRSTPRAALLSTLSGIALGFIALGFVLQTFAYPIVGLGTFSVVMLTYFGRVRFKFGLPGGLVAVALGTALAWATGIAPGDATPRAAEWVTPMPIWETLLDGLEDTSLWRYFAIILPMGLFNVIGSLQNIEAAEAAGDRFRTGPSLAANGLGTLVAAAFGSCFPTTIYIGHPGWKAMGARAGYSALNGVFMAAICLTGTLASVSYLIPVEAGMAIILWIGIIIVAQAFQTTPRHHAPAVVVGMIPGLAAWGAMMAKGGMKAAGLGTPENGFVERADSLVEAFAQGGIFLEGALTLERGFIFTSMILAAATVAIIERKFLVAATWCSLAALLSAVGLIHTYEWTESDSVMSLGPSPSFTLAYGLMAVLFLAARKLCSFDGEDPESDVPTRPPL